MKTLLKIGIAILEIWIVGILGVAILIKMSESEGERNRANTVRINVRPPYRMDVSRNIPTSNASHP